MEDYRSMTTPMVTNVKKVITSDSGLVDPRIYTQMIGCLMYLVNTNPDICFVVNTLSHFMVDPRQVHWISVKHVLRNLRCIVEYGLRYLRGYGEELQGYTNSDWAWSAIDIKRTAWCFSSLGSTIITWFSGTQTYVVISSTEA
jgi:hypothetical protein